MKAQKKSVAVAELQKTIRRWRSCKITDSTISKLLELYLGLTAYMNDERVYPVENFYDIKLSLRFATTQALVEAVKQCRSFKFILNDERSRIQAFYSPLWRDEKSENSTDHSTVPAAVPQNLPQAFAQTFAADNIYNINTKGDSSEEEFSPSGDEPSDKIPTQKNIVTPDSLAAAKEFFHIINGVPAQKGQMLTPLIDWFQLHEGLTRQHACENLVYLVNELLIPYFAGQVRFMKSNHTGRLCWLGNLMKFAHGQHLLNDAARESRKKREQAVLANRSTQRNNHPLCEFEWTDPESGLRFYDDAIEGVVNIPDEAQPRPSAEAVWNVLSEEWVITNY